MGHLPLLAKFMKQHGGCPEMIPAINGAFNMCDSDIVTIDIPGLSTAGLYLTSNPQYAGIVSTDHEHFGKITHLDKRGGYYSSRKVVGNALFVASDTDPDWGKAHRVLMPAFSPAGLKSLADITLRKTDILLDRMGGTKPFEIGKTFTSITFDVIGNYVGGPGLDFKTTEHPERMATDNFLVAMDIALTTKHLADKPFAGRRKDRKLYRKRQKAIKTLHESAMQIINDRIDGKTSSLGGPKNPDVLDRMLHTIDKETNEKMDLELIRNHLILFLLVGHDSTSSLLTSLTYVLTQHPEVEQKIREEVHHVMGDSPPTMDNIKKLTYTMAVIKETLRLYPPAQALAKMCVKDTSLGPYSIKKGARVLVLVGEVQKNKDCWGETADLFDPSRFLPGATNGPTHEYAWLPFSSGPRACLGMQFSLIEARIILARMMQRYTFRLHKDAQVKEKFRIFMKLSNVWVTAHEINPASSNSLSSSVSSSLSSRFSSGIMDSTAATSLTKSTASVNLESHDGKLNVYFGSNMGTCEELAENFCDEGTRMGFDSTLQPLDAAASEGGLSKESLTLIVTSTYNGQPPDNAKQFAKYCASLEPGSLAGTKIAILGIGNSNWKSFQNFPTSIEAALASAGAEIICPRGVADEEKDLQDAVETWREEGFWPSAFETVGLDPATSIMCPAKSLDPSSTGNVPKLLVTDSTEQSTSLLRRSPENEFATVMSARELQCPTSGRSTRHIEFKLPSGMKYSEGDHIAIVPHNNPELVLRIASLINEQDLGRTVTLAAVANNGNGNGNVRLGHLPLELPVTIFDLLGRHIDLQAPLTASFMKAAADSANDPEEAETIASLLDLVSDDSWKQMRPIQILTAFPSVRMSLAQILATVPPMKKRYYSISSSPLGSSGPTIATVTVGLVQGTNDSALHGLRIESEDFRGVCSGYLADIRPGELVEVMVAANDRFRLPQKDPSAPVLMIGPGTGVAPFRGFVQALEAEEGQRPATLFFGCRNEKDYLYRSELEASTKLELHTAFSRPITSDSTTMSKKKEYVQDLLWKNRDQVWEMLQHNEAHIYICGDGRHMAKDVDNTLHRIAEESGKMSQSDAITFFETLQKNDRYLQDVWCN